MQNLWQNSADSIKERFIGNDNSNIEEHQLGSFLSYIVLKHSNVNLNLSKYFHDFYDVSVDKLEFKYNKVKEVMISHNYNLKKINNIHYSEFVLILLIDEVINTSIHQIISDIDNIRMTNHEDSSISRKIKKSHERKMLEYKENFMYEGINIIEYFKTSALNERNSDNAIRYAIAYELLLDFQRVVYDEI